MIVSTAREIGSVTETGIDTGIANEIEGTATATATVTVTVTTTVHRALAETNRLVIMSANGGIARKNVSVLTAAASWSETSMV